MRRFILSVLFSLMALAPAACDETTDTKDVAQVDEDLASSEDIANPAGYQGMTTLCPVIVTCDFGFTEETCQAEFLSFCKDASKKETYLDCMSDCYDTYQTGKDCDSFKNCESGCWNDSGC